MPLAPGSRRLRYAVLSAVGVAALLVSPALGRASTTAEYRPRVAPDGLSTGCYPLPGGVTLPVTAVLRRDGETLTAAGVRRRLLLHVDRLDAAAAVAEVEAAFAAAGVAGLVTVTGRDLDVPDDALVRSSLVLDLPPIAPQLDDRVCSDENSTKRFLPDLPDDS